MGDKTYMCYFGHSSNKRKYNTRPDAISRPLQGDLSLWRTGYIVDAPKSLRHFLFRAKTSFNFITKCKITLNKIKQFLHERDITARFSTTYAHKSDFFIDFEAIKRKLALLVAYGASR